jgi:hypothetical protein
MSSIKHIRLYQYNSKLFVTLFDYEHKLNNPSVLLDLITGINVTCIITEAETLELSTYESQRDSESL